MGPGDFFGEIALISKAPRTATVTTTTPVRALVITDRAFRQLLEHVAGDRGRRADRARRAPRSELDLDPRAYTSAMAVDERKIAILGAGKIGEALLAGLLSSGWRTPAELSASTRREERAAELRERHGIDVTLSNAEARPGAALVVVAVKPQDIETLLGEIGPLIQPEQTVLSIAAAIPTAAIERHLGAGVPVVRAMPNTPCDRPRGNRRHLRRRPRRRGAPDARRGGAAPPRRRRPRLGAVHGRGHGRLGLRARLLRAARRGDDRGRASCSASRARSRRSSSSRRCSGRRSCCAT